MHQLKPQILQQKGWIATNFKIKNNVCAILKTRQRNMTEINRADHTNGPIPIHFKSTEFSRQSKPSTAPQKTRFARIQRVQNDNINPLQGELQDQIFVGCESKFSNFKTTLNNRKQLLFLKPYARNRNRTMTIDQRKTQIYKQINHPDLANFNLSFKQNGPIEYLTEYSEPFSGRQEKQSHSKVVSGRQNRASLNVLREKLKRRCQLSFYQTKTGKSK